MFNLLTPIYSQTVDQGDSVQFVMFNLTGFKSWSVGEDHGSGRDRDQVLDLLLETIQLYKLGFAPALAFVEF